MWLIGLPVDWFTGGVADVDFYFRRFGFCGRLIEATPPAGLRMVVVVPSHDEPDLIGSLESLAACAMPEGSVEVIVVVNGAVTADAALRERNAASAEAARRWIDSRSAPGFTLHVIECPDLPRKHAGVGLARKIGMDEAVRRLSDVGAVDEGVLLCYDADCRCDGNLLSEVACWFREHPGSPGCSICFEHPLGQGGARQNEAIAQYELHLRYHIEGCRWAGHPFAYHTIGSSMAVSASAYVRQGGMNRRQAGEDFYFLQKIIPLGGFGEVNTTRVIPSPRTSHRVPFGTGRAVGDYCIGDVDELLTYPLAAYECLRGFFMDIEKTPGGLLGEFLRQRDHQLRLEEMRRHTAGEGAFRKRFFRWFDAFMVMKWMHYARDNEHGARPVRAEAARLRARLDGSEGVDLLEWYRRRQRQGFQSAFGGK